MNKISLMTGYRDRERGRGLRDGRHDVSGGAAMVVDKQMMILSQRSAASILIYQFGGITSGVCQRSKIEAGARARSDVGVPFLVEMGDFQRAGEEAHGR